MKHESNPMVEFFERLGHEVIRSENAWWYDAAPQVLLSLPYYRLIEPGEEEVDELLHKHKLRAIRYPTTLESYGFMSNITVNTDKNYDMSNLHQKARNQTRRGLENCVIEPVDFDYLIEHGLSLNQDTARRQERESQYADPDYWRKYCQAAKAVEGVSAWGAFVEGKLASFIISIEAEGNWREWVVNHSSTELRNKYPNNALAFTAAQHFFQKEKCEGICYGLGSLEDTTYLDHFKGRMGWTIQPIKQRLIFSKKFRLTFSFAQEPCLWILNKIFPKNYTVRKTSAMIRLYRQQTYDMPCLDNE